MRLIVFFCGFLGLLTLSSLMKPSGETPGVRAAIDHFKTEAASFAASCTRLKNIARTKDREATRLALIDCRCRYKRVEAFLEYFFRSSATIYNRAPKYEAEEGGMEYQSPIGMQLIESILFDPHPDKKALLEQVDAVENAALDLPALLYDLHADDPQILESMRIELIRVMALDITGYEAPLLKSGILESEIALDTWKQQLQPYLGDDARSDSVRLYSEKAMRLLHNKSFDDFDRLAFLRDAMLPLQHQFGLFIREHGLVLNTSKTMDYAADDLFSPNALLPEKFPGGDSGTAMIGLGKQVFNDKRLSGNGQKSCASCHDPAKGFTDHLPVSIGFDGHQRLDRNAPTLLYSAYQFDQFWDGRAKSLEQQIRTVLHDAREMHADTVKESDVLAIASYVRSLHPFSSPFDRYIRHENNGLSPAAIKGANLFMGKAQCATCHFIPLFNGLIPPDYAITEFEVLGTTSSDSLKAKSLHLSADQGRYTQYPLDFFKGAFKTPTVRNGAFHSLETVIEFYNEGGGTGLGLSVPDQSLSSGKLRLTVEEKKDLILFIHSLTDSLHPGS